MSVLIHGMEMPTSCMTCLFQNPYMGGWCSLLNDNSNAYSRRRDCPLIPVPKHGRLIDADALADSFEPSDFWNSDAEDNCFAAVRIVHSAPTIIPAEEDQT